MLHCAQFPHYVKIMFIFEGSEIETDSEGYLKETTQWSEAMAEVIAAQEGISLSVEHWEVVRFVRDFSSGVQHFASHPYAGQSHGE